MEKRQAYSRQNDKTKIKKDRNGGRRMTLDEAIKHCEEVAKEMDKVCETGINEFGFYISDLCADDTEVIEETMTNYSRCSEDHRQLAEWLKELKRDREILDGLSIYFQSLVIDAVINQRPLMFDMRDATKEERESVKQYIADSAKTTGVNFWNLIGEVNADENSN